LGFLPEEIILSKNGLFVEYCAKDFIDGCNVLDPWEELAYRRICDLIYTTENRLENDDQKLVWQTKVGNRWKRIKKKLLDLGKIRIEDGFIRNEKCDKTLEKSARNIAQKSSAGSASAEKRKGLKNNKTGPAAVGVAVGSAVPTAGSTNQESKNPSISPPSGGSPRDVAGKAVAFWNEFAERNSLPMVRVLPKSRKGKLLKRIEQAGGLEEWKLIVSKIEKISWMLVPAEGKTWKANFDFILQESSFIKLMEGAYDGDLFGQPTAPKQQAEDWRTRVRGWLKSQLWIPRWGEPPDHPHTWVPDEILKEFKLERRRNGADSHDHTRTRGLAPAGPIREAAGTGADDQRGVHAAAAGDGRRPHPAAGRGAG
jgi:hypothetical protein